MINLVIIKIMVKGTKGKVSRKEFEKKCLFTTHTPP